MNKTKIAATAARVGRALMLLVMLLSLVLPAPVASAQTENVGYRDFSYPSGTGGNNEPTGEKPESKLWWNDGFWYASMWSTAGKAYHIHRLELASQTWADTGTAIDARLGTRADALWDSASGKLYIVSHVFSKSPAPTDASQRGLLFRYSYNPTAKTYTLDPGFPVEVTGGRSETLTIAKDSKGQLWVTYVESQKVMVNRSLNSNDLTWGTPFVLPAGGAENVSSDDISAVISYNQHIGVMWSNQNKPKTMYFAVHPANSPDNVWTRARAYAVSGDDHMNLKSLQSDPAGNVFSVIKTSRSANLIMVLVCKNNMNHCRSEEDWLSYTVYNSSVYKTTRPILLIDTDNRHLYVFTTNVASDTLSGIYYKRSSLDDISFDASSIGTAFIRSDLDTNINNATSTHQNVNAATGLVVLASSTRSRHYLHNYLALDGGSAPPLPVITAFSPTSGPVGSEVTITGSNFTGATQVTFHGTPAGFTVDSSTKIRAVVPDGAASGPVSVSGPSGTGTSSGSFTVTVPTGTQYALSVIVSGSGAVSLDPPGGSYTEGTVVQLTAAPSAGWEFTGWSGSLSGSANPDSITIDGNKSVTASFNQSTGGGTVAYEETVTGTALSSSTVSTSGSITGAGGNLYLAAVSSRNSSTVSSVTGLGLSWTRVLRQCAGRNQTMLDVWMAVSPSATTGTVTAQFPAAVKSAVIVVSRFSGANTAAPVGTVLGGNTAGVDGSCSTGTDSSAYAFNLATTSPGSLVYGAVAMRNRTHTPGSGYAERGEVAAGSGGDVSSVAVMDQGVLSPSTVALNGTFSGTVDWAVVGIEIKP